jgi:hypothetical protein
MRNRVARFLLSLTLALGALSTLTASDGIREDELRCEEAKKHLMDCCGADFVDVDCHYYAGGCDEAPTPPQLDVQQSTCILGANCEQLLPFCSEPTAVASCE